MPIGYLVRRIGQFFLVLWGAATLNFFMPRLAPGNPVRERLISQATQGGPLQEGIEEMVRAYNIEFGLDKPLWVQYVRYSIIPRNWISATRSRIIRPRSCR